MKILNFSQFSLLELKSSSDMIKQNEIVNLQFTDDIGKHLTRCKMIDHGWALNRTIIFYRFLVLETNSEKYPVGAEFILSLDFDDKVDTFLIYPYYNEKPGIRSMVQYKYKAHCKIV